MSWLSKQIHSIGKLTKTAAGRLAVQAGRAGLASVTGGASEGAIKAGETVGRLAHGYKVAKRKARRLRLAKSTYLKPGAIQPLITREHARTTPAAKLHAPAIAMPGGAPLTPPATSGRRNKRRLTYGGGPVAPRSPKNDFSDVRSGSSSSTGAVTRRRRKRSKRPASSGQTGPDEGKTQAQTNRANKRRGKRAGGSKRKPPTGGLDLKALSVSWKAAGKPGRWIDWVKSHR